MNKKNDKRLCWNCDGDVSLHLTQCPFCGVDVTKPGETHMESTKRLGSPFQQSSTGNPSSGVSNLGAHPSGAHPSGVPKPPYANIFSKEYSVSEDEWNQALEEEKEVSKKEESEIPTSKKEMVALLLLLPGVVFCLFALALLLFSHDGVLTLKWNQNLAYFYLLGALPLIYLGWRYLK